MKNNLYLRSRVMSQIPVWQMVKEAVIAIGSNTIANADIKNTYSTTTAR
jgi:hypothetical protein